MVMNMCLARRDETGFIQIKKYIIPLTEPEHLSGYFFHINTQLESNKSLYKVSLYKLHILSVLIII